MSVCGLLKSVIMVFLRAYKQSLDFETKMLSIRILIPKTISIKENRWTYLKLRLAESYLIKGDLDKAKEIIENLT